MLSHINKQQNKGFHNLGPQEYVSPSMVRKVLGMERMCVQNTKTLRLCDKYGVDLPNVAVEKLLWRSRIIT